MTKIALALAIVAIGEGAVTLHLVNQLHAEREMSQLLQARVTQLESKAPQAAQGATFIAVPTQSTLSPFTTVKKDGAPPAPAQQAIAGVITSSDVSVVNRAMPMAPDQERMREQVKQSMERQAALLRDPEYREAMLAQQKMGARQSNPNLARDLDLSPEQADRLFSTLAEQQLRAMETTSPMLWSEQPDPAKMQELQRKMMDQQRANEMEVKRVLGEAKFREYQEYQSLSGVRWEAERVRTALANAGMPLEENLTKPLLKTLQEQQQKMMRQMAAAAGPQNQLIAASGVGATVVTSSDGVSGNMIEMQEKSVELQAQHQKRQREALARVLTPEQLKVIEDEHKMELQMQRAQIKMMRAQQEAGLLDPAQGGFVQGEAVTLTPSVVTD
ncbi:MAG TPA: hypothetical protein VN705_15940 [Steroidobacteraceae bacterium]|jgi:hypothetical protein|nr:hypothetical protein [Steroidobacteraceae bacterium]